MFTVQKKLFFFFLTSGYFLRAPDNSNFIRFPLKVRESTVLAPANRSTSTIYTQKLFATSSNAFSL